MGRIQEAISALEDIIWQEMGVKACIEINMHPTRNPQLSFYPAAHNIASGFSRELGIPLQHKSREGTNWFSIGNDVTVFCDDNMPYEFYQAMGFLMD